MANEGYLNKLSSFYDESREVKSLFDRAGVAVKSAQVPSTTDRAMGLLYDGVTRDDVDYEYRQALSVSGLPAGPGAPVTRTPNQNNVDVSWLALKTQDVNISNLDPKIISYLNSLPDNLKKQVLVTSGNNPAANRVKNSWHDHNGAIDLRFSKELHDYVSNDSLVSDMGLEVVRDPYHAGRDNPHTHIELQGRPPQTR